MCIFRDQGIHFTISSLQKTQVFDLLAGLGVGYCSRGGLPDHSAMDFSNFGREMGVSPKEGNDHGFTVHASRPMR